jgi:hypothetical protein
MSRYRKLKGLAHNLADKFSISCEHFAYRAISEGIPEITADLLDPSISPARLASERNLNLIRMCNRDILRYVGDFETSPIRFASLTAAFHLCEETRSVERRITVSICDDRQRVWSAVVSDIQQTLSP